MSWKKKALELEKKVKEIEEQRDDYLDRNRINYNKLLELEKKFAKLATYYMDDFINKMSTDWDHCFAEEKEE